MRRSQTERILEHLRTGHQLTAVEALDRFGCLRLAARVADLKRDGHDVRAVTVERGGKRFASYYLAHHEPCQVSLPGMARSAGA